MWIFDRWGSLIWETKKWGEGWDGRANGGKDIAQEDVYVWKIKCYDALGKKHAMVGHVSLVR
jgi:gliding motility-associated-like protein